MQKVNHEELECLIRYQYYTKLPLFIYGAYGIGKSQTMKRCSRKIAEERDKEHVEWNGASRDRKYDLIDDPEKNFVLIDIRLAQLDPSDIKGIPDLKGRAVEWKPPLWIYFASRKNADGIIFFDEANLAPPSVQSALYQVVHDREAGEYSISDDIAVIAAGNRLEDKSNIYRMSEALKDRYNEVELRPPTIESWINNFAIPQKIDARIIAYLRWNPDKLHKPQLMEKDVKSTTPRGWEKLSKSINGIDDVDMIRIIAGTIVGEGVASEFKSFCELQEEVDVLSFFEDPETAEIPERLDLKHSLIAGMTEYYKQDRSEDKLRAILIVADRIEPEFGVLMLRMSKKADESYFKEHVLGIDKWKKISRKYGKYLLD